MGKNSLQGKCHPLIAVTLLLSLCMACASDPNLKPALPAAVPVTSMVLSPGDEIEIKFAYAEQFNELQAIRPDGKIELQFLGEVQAAGKTPAQLREELKDRFAAHLKHPQLALIVRNFNEQRVYVGGEVNTPGMIPMPNRMTALEAIMEAGGFDFESARTSTVIIMRHDPDGKRQGYVVDLKPNLEGVQADAFYLQPRDIVFVPRTTIRKYNQWVEQYIEGIIPDVGLTFGRTLGRTSFGYDTSD